MGQLELKDELRKIVYNSLKQRIIVNYTYKGLNRNEVKEYIQTRLEYANANKNIFTQEAINAIYSCSNTSPRRINNLITNSLMLGFQTKSKIIDAEIVMNAKKEMDI